MNKQPTDGTIEWSVDGPERQVLPFRLKSSQLTEFTLSELAKRKDVMERVVAWFEGRGYRCERTIGYMSGFNLYLPGVCGVYAALDLKTFVWRALESGMTIEQMLEEADEPISLAKAMEETD